MYLKSLTLKGFKSFASPTTFAFEPGVTAIVGPNGSGKSNVLDALAWVMGEQGAKTLRGGKMEDVIFAGTSSRGPLGRAEVKLTIDNSDGALPIEYTEVTISRTLFRSGASEYAINGENCRLLDVQELLSDSGLGREMHVIVGQGQLDSVLRASPEERRGFIEEAAGILKHRKRRERTLRKLDAMQANLTRLNDLAAELRRQLKPLGKQAEVARRAQDIARTVRDAKARILADDVAKLSSELKELSASETERNTARALLQQKLEAQQQRITALEKQEHSEKLDTARRLVVDFEAQLGKLASLKTQAAQRLEFLTTQHDDSAQPPGVTAADVERVTAEAKRLDALVPESEQALAAAEQTVETHKQQLQQIDAQLAEQRVARNSYDLKLSQLGGAAEAAAQRVTGLKAELQRRTDATVAAAARAREAAAQLDQFTAKTADAGQLGSAAHTAALEAEYSRLEEEVAELETARDRAQTELHAAERDRAALEAQVAALAAALNQKDASADIIAEKLPGVTGRVAQAITVTAGQEAAVGALLGSYSEALLVTDAAAAKLVATHAAAHELGRVRTVIASGTLNTKSAAKRAMDAAETAAAALAQVAGEHGAVWAPDVVTAPPGVRQLLFNSFIATDLEQAFQLAAALGAHTAFFTVVTAAGELVTAQTLTGGSKAAPSLVQLQSEHDAALVQLATVAQLVVTRAETLEQSRAAAKAAKAAAAEAYTALRKADAARAEHAAKQNRLAAAHEAAAAEVERATGWERESAARLTEAETAHEAAVAAVAAHEATPRPAVNSDSREEHAAAYEAARAAAVEQRLALESARERARSAGRAEQRMRQQFAAAEAAAAERARRTVLRNRQAQQAQLVLKAVPEFIAACEDDLSRAQEQRIACEAERAKHSQELTLLRSAAAEVRQELTAVTEQAHGAELKLYERKLGLKALTERASSELGLTVEVLLAEYGPDQPVPLAVTEDSAAESGIESAESAAESTAESAESVATAPYNRQQQEQRLRTAERQLRELGRINPLALEEFAALSERHKFMHEQLTDLNKTRQDLLQIVADLDAKMETIFAAAFADTRAAFENVFPVLFPGGSGHISLTDPDNMLTTGIEIAVRPAGKKIERMSLLSGGERSLAAVAWLIAIFKARPSPFYIMDEVEAALDDANLGRLLAAFEDLRQRSQLIVITHQKRTMEIADALYGVSMRGDGVSAVVGQRLNQE